VTLTALNLARFKAFADSQRIPIRPITLIFGANSAGKSSIIHALALAHHALETGDLDVQRTQVGGESIDLTGRIPEEVGLLRGEPRPDRDLER